nr:amidohydrolase family protein [Lacticaseibacillus thailandensis]
MTPDAARAAFDQWRQHYEETGVARLENQDVINYLLALVAPALINQHLPLQFHVGYGDADTDLYLGNPLLLRSFLRRFCYDGLQVVLLHCYPYHREAGYLASVFPGVYFDTSLVNNLAPSSTMSVVRESLELAPYSRYLFASDASTYVEMYAVAAQTFKAALAAQLDAVTTATDAQKQSWARMVCYANAANLYGVAVTATD